MAAFVTMIGTEPMRTPYTTKTTEPASEIVRRRTTEVIVSESTTSADAT